MSIGTYATAARLLDLRRLRALYRGLRANIQIEPPETPDAALVDLVAEPYESPADVNDRLNRLRDVLRDAGDRRAIFLTIYARMTRDVREGLDRGNFENPDWMADYVVAFAEYYREAFLAFEQGRLNAVPKPWRIAFGTSLAGDGLVMQDAFLGISAHINYDLAYAVRDAGIEGNRASKYADHRRINDVLAGLVDAQQQALADLYAPGIDAVDAALGPLDESFSLFSMAEAREQAWRVAVVLTDISFDPIDRYARWVLKTTATGAAAVVLAPRLDPRTMEALRTVEDGHIDLETALDKIESALD